MTVYITQPILISPGSSPSASTSPTRIIYSSMFSHMKKPPSPCPSIWTTPFPYSFYSRLTIHSVLHDGKLGSGTYHPWSANQGSTVAGVRQHSVQDFLNVLIHKFIHCRQKLSTLVYVRCVLCKFWWMYTTTTLRLICRTWIIFSLLCIWCINFEGKISPTYVLPVALAWNFMCIAYSPYFKKHLLLRNVHRMENRHRIFPSAPYNPGLILG